MYIDTCNAFLSANPQFPSSPLLRTFVMDRKGTVLLVGNPFNGDRMKSMLDKIVDNKRRQHAASVGMIAIDGLHASDRTGIALVEYSCKYMITIKI